MTIKVAEHPTGAYSRNVVPERVVVLVSGGLDSATLLYDASQQYICYPLTLQYGQKHIKETELARQICESLNMQKRWRCVDLSVLQSLLPSALTSESAIPEGWYADESMKQTVVPNRNLILLSIAAGYAKGIGASVIMYAAHMGDHPIYPDCRPEFIAAASEAIMLGTGWGPNEGIKLITPYNNLTKANIVERGLTLGVPYQKTWSCYGGGERPCLRCGTCVERTEAFMKSGEPDPSLTTEEWNVAVAVVRQLQKLQMESDSNGD